jgi:hypothetical protein
MAGSLSRDIGLRAERGMVNWLRANGYPQARRLLAGDGRQQGDIDGLGCCIEVKAGKTLRLRPWLAQLDAERAGLVGFLVWKPPGVANPADWWVFFTAPNGDVIRTTVFNLWGT